MNSAHVTVARVINLASRPDRWEAVQSAWAGVASVRLQRYEAARHFVPDGTNHTVNGCTISHARLVEDAFAADAELQVLLVLEDDAVPRPDFDARFGRILEYALGHLAEWHLINLGTSAGKPLPGWPADGRELIMQLRSPELLRTTMWSSQSKI